MIIITFRGGPRHNHIQPRISQQPNLIRTQIIIRLDGEDISGMARTPCIVSIHSVPIGDHTRGIASTNYFPLLIVAFNTAGPLPVEETVQEVLLCEVIRKGPVHDQVTVEFG